MPEGVEANLSLTGWDETQGENKVSTVLLQEPYPSLSATDAFSAWQGMAKTGREVAKFTKRSSQALSY